MGTWKSLRVQGFIIVELLIVCVPIEILTPLAKAFIFIAQIGPLSYQAAIEHKPRQVRWGGLARSSGRWVVASMFA